jgi:hypothetical protein
MQALRNASAARDMCRAAVATWAGLFNALVTALIVLDFQGFEWAQLLLQRARLG